MKKIIFIITALLAVGCAPLTTSDIQSAKLVNKGEYELTPSISLSINTIYFGLQGAYGLAENANLRMRIERIKIKTDFEDELNYFNFKESLTHFSFGVKYNIFKDELAFYMPISFTYNNLDSFTLIEPTMLFTKSGKHSELNSSLKILITEQGETIDVINIGLGTSRNINKWVLRPELGCLGFISSDFKACLPQVSLGLSINVSSN